MKIKKYIEKTLFVLLTIELILSPCLVHANQLILDEEKISRITLRRRFEPNLNSKSTSPKSDQSESFTSSPDVKEAYGHPVQKDANNRYLVSFKESFLAKDHHFYLFDEDKPIGYLEAKNKNVSIFGFENHDFLLNGGVNLTSLRIECGGNLTLSKAFDVKDFSKLKAKNIQIDDNFVSLNSLIFQAENQIDFTGNSYLRSDSIFVAGGENSQFNNNGKIEVGKEFLINVDTINNANTIMSSGDIGIEADRVSNQGKLLSNQDLNALIYRLPMKIPY